MEDPEGLGSGRREPYPDLPDIIWKRRGGRNSHVRAFQLPRARHRSQGSITAPADTPLRLKLSVLVGKSGSVAVTTNDTSSSGTSDFSATAWMTGGRFTSRIPHRLAVHLEAYKSLTTHIANHHPDRPRFGPVFSRIASRAFFNDFLEGITALKLRIEPLVVRDGVEATFQVGVIDCPPQALSPPDLGTL